MSFLKPLIDFESLKYSNILPLVEGIPFAEVFNSFPVIFSIAFLNNGS